MKYLVREMRPQEYPLLEEFLYEAIFQRDENNLLPKTIINDPALQVYIKDFGTMNDDYCLCAEVNKEIVGAVWVRIIVGFGNLDDKTPEFAILLYKNYRGYGIGTEMMRRTKRSTLWCIIYSREFQIELRKWLTESIKWEIKGVRSGGNRV